MKDFAGRIAIATGASSERGRKLVCELVAEAFNVAMCDLGRAGDGGNAAPVFVESSGSDR